MLATEYEATDAARVTWGRVSRILAAWWFGSKEDFARRRWFEDYGTRIQQGHSDPMALITEAVFAEKALEALRGKNRQAYLLMVHLIEHPEDRWHNERGTGVADLLNLEGRQARCLYEAGKAYLHHLLGEEELDRDAERILTPAIDSIYELCRLRPCAHQLHRSRAPQHRR